MSFFISDAVAATGAPAQGSPMSLILMLVVFGLIFYFMICVHSRSAPRNIRT